MQLPPVEVILSWPTPNYVDPKHVRGPTLPIITFVLFPIALLTVALRTFTRLFISKSFGVDDWFLLAAIVPTVACAALSLLALQRLEWNRHIWDVSPDLITLGLKLTTIECAFALAVSLTKMSMLILTRRILTGGTGIMRNIAAFLMFIVTTEALIFCFVVVFTCSPPSAYWTLSETPQHCINEKIHLVLGGSINTFTDFGVVLLPLPTVLSLKINRRQQAMLASLFGAGFVICVAGVFRIYFEYKAMSTFDRTWESFGLWIAGVVELYLGVICTAIPACKPFFSRYLPALFGSSHGTSERYSNAPSVHLPRLKPSANSSSHQETLSSQTSKQCPPIELHRIPKSKFCTNIMRNSKHLLPLSYLESPTAVPERSEIKRSSNETSISSFFGRNPSPVSSEFHTAGPSDLERGHQSDSIEELVGQEVIIRKV